MSLDIDFQSKTIYWNPIIGPCYNNCFYCNKKKFHKQQLQFVDVPLVIKDDRVVQVCPSLDILSPLTDPFRPSNDITKYTNGLSIIFNKIKNNPNTTFIIKTKNPKYIINHKALPNLIWWVGCETDGTIKTDAQYGYDRLNCISQHKQNYQSVRIILFITPILKFSDSFAHTIKQISPEVVVIGANKLPIDDEPTGDEIRDLISSLSSSNIPIILNRSVKRLLRD